MQTLAKPPQIPARRDSTDAKYTDFAATGPGTMAGRYMRLFWHPVFVASELERERPLPLRVMGEELTIYRGHTGTPHVVAGRCAHRAVLMHIGSVEGDDIRCVYHGWKYSSDGRCNEIPADTSRAHEKVAIRSYPTREYLGLIFVYIGEGEPPPLPRYPDFEEEGVLDIRTNLRPCNYFQDVENNVDPAHTPFTHAISRYSDSGLLSVPEVIGDETEWGIGQYSRRPEGTRVSHHGMPTLLNLKFQPEDEGGWKDFLAWRVPIDDDSHINFLVAHAKVTGDQAERVRQAIRAREAKLRTLPSAIDAAAAVLSSRARIADFSDHPDLLMIQDHVTQMAQGTRTDRSKEHLARSDVLVIKLRRIWSREMRAMDEGLPLKQWVRSEAIRPTNGLDRLHEIIGQNMQHASPSQPAIVEKT